eukprot:10026382-Alexandrium_andersonii.AAC.1
MSASLVGSEMCIRDRAKPTGSSSPRACPGPSKRSGLGGPSIRASPRCSPVSYTHLTLPTICSV